MFSFKPYAGTSPFEARSQHCEKRLLAWSCLSVRLSIRMEQLGSHLTDFNDILYLWVFPEIFQEKSDFDLKSDKNDT